jgi:hypothetical protein
MHFYICVIVSYHFFTVGEKLEKLDDKCEMKDNKLDQRASSGIDSATNKDLVPGKFGKVQVIIGRIYEKLDGKDLKLVVNTFIKKLENESLSLDEMLKDMRKFYLMKMDIHEKFDHGR